MSIQDTLNHSFKNEDFNNNNNINSFNTNIHALSTDRTNDNKQVLQTIETLNKAIPKAEF